MAIQTTFDNGDRIRKVLDFHLSIQQPIDYSGKVCGKSSFRGLTLLLEVDKHTDLFRWMISNDMAKQVELKVTPADLSSKSETIILRDAHCVGYTFHYNHQSKLPPTLELRITAAGFKWDSAELSEYWQTTPFVRVEQKVVEEPQKDPKILDGWWTSDREGQEHIEKANLGDTVYFHVDTSEMDAGEEIDLKLYDLDVSTADEIMGTYVLDYFSPDDDEFNEREVRKTGYVNDEGIATIELSLQEDWEEDLAEDVGHDLELYWEATHNGKTKSIPSSKNNYLEVEFSERTLYFKPTVAGTNLPELVSYDGHPLVLLEFAKGKLKGKAKSQFIKAIEKTAEAKIKNIALAKLDKQELQTKATPFSQDWRNDYYTQEEKLVKELKDRDWSEATEPIEKHTYTYYSNKGNRVKLLGVLKDLGNILDLFDVVSFGMADLDTDEPISLELGPLTPLSDVVGILVKGMKAKDDALLEESIQRDVDRAKLKGLDATRAEINNWNHNEEYNWQLMAVSTETADKLVKGEFKKFEELEASKFEDRDFSNNIQILYREIENTNRDEYVYVIETIFFDEQ